MILAQDKLQLTAVQVKLLEEKLDTLLAEVMALENNEEDAQMYSFTAACFPIKRSTCC